MDKSPFSRLPGELRNTIYTLALTSEDPIDLYDGEPPLTRSCRQMRQESLLLHSSLNDFILDVFPGKGQQAAQCVTRQNSEKLHSMHSWHVICHVKVVALGPLILRTNSWEHDLVCAALVAKGLKKDQVSFSVRGLLGGTFGNVDDRQCRDELQRALSGLQREVEWAFEAASGTE